MPPGARILGGGPMSSIGPAAVANTDERWFGHFVRNGVRRVVDEVNFWRPISQDSRFGVVGVGGPFFFRLKAPQRAIAGYGFFGGSLQMTVATAWEIFGEKNGDATYSSFLSRIAGYRRGYGQDVRDLGSQKIVCLVIREAVFLPPSEWLPWDVREGWADQVVATKGYDLGSGPGAVLAELMEAVGRGDPPPDLRPDFEPVVVDQRVLREQMEPVREGQGAFRVRLLSAYGSACAVTREHALPVLEAAHIEPYLGVASNHVQNGLILRTDLHRLYDGGYVTVTPDFRLEVSHRLKDEFDNGHTYYEMAGTKLFVPEDMRQRPSAKALEWHAQNVFW